MLLDVGLPSSVLPEQWVLYVAEFESMTFSAVFATRDILLLTAPAGPTRPVPVPKRMPSAYVLSMVLFSNSTLSMAIADANAESASSLDVASECTSMPA